MLFSYALICIFYAYMSIEKLNDNACGSPAGGTFYRACNAFNENPPASSGQVQRLFIRKL
jgi:hypothetical protein